MAENSVGRGRCPNARVTQNAQGCQNCQLLKLSIFLNFFFARTIFALPSTKKPNLGSSWSIYLRGVGPRTTFANPWNHTGACGSDQGERSEIHYRGGSGGTGQIMPELPQLLKGGWTKPRQTFRGSLGHMRECPPIYGFLKNSNIKTLFSKIP